MKTHIISCVIPTFNSSKTIEATLLSLKTQRGTDVKIMVADSGSTDDTLEICHRWNVPTIYVPPGNMYQAINAGLCKMETEWIFYLNSDDIVFNDSLARLINLGISQNADICYGDCDYIDEVGRFLYSFRSAAPLDLLHLFRCQRMGFAQQTAIYRRSIFEELNGFDESLRFRADADFFIRAVLACKKFVRLSSPAVACFRLHQGQFSNQGLIDTELEAKRIFGRAELNPSIRDRLTLLHWQFQNGPHYMIRILRESALSGRVRMPRSIELYDHI
jgi:glycosyltransferase involved in cell wall biosynthesis